MNRIFAASDSEGRSLILKEDSRNFPVRFDLPEQMKEELPASVTRSYEGFFVMRFYCTPMANDTIEHGGLTWRVTHLAHSPQRKGSPKGDECPIVMTEFIGAAE
jgi:hypothetical protein